METENIVPLTEPKKSVLTGVTPLSKYFALSLFIAMPFIGGWVGYTYAPGKVIVIEKLAIEEAEMCHATDTTEEPSSTPLPDTEEQEGPLPLFKTSPIRCEAIGACYFDGETFAIYKYNLFTQRYEPLDESILQGLLKIDPDTGRIRDGFITIRGWSSDLRYVMFSSESKLYYVDTENPQKGALDAGGLYIHGNSWVHDWRMMSPNRSKILGLKNRIKYLGFENDLYVFDINDLTAKKIFSHDGTVFTFLDHDGYIDAKWLSDDEVQIKISTMENLEEFRDTQTTEKWLEYDAAKEIKVVKVE